MTGEELEAIEAREKAATPGPWVWEIRAATRQAYLWTTHSGRYYVMGFQRWGMNSAAPTFQVYEKCQGPVDERGSKGMFRADSLTKSLPGKEYNVGYDDYLDHPDAEFIAHARQDIPALIAENKRLSAEVESVKRERDAAIADLLDHIMSEGYGCKYCKHDNSGESYECANCDRYCDRLYDQWEWRGVRE